jgi:hypothetical protein
MAGLAALVALCTAPAAAATVDRLARSHPGATHVLSGSRSHRSAATLDVVSGVTSVVVTAGTGAGLLYQVRTPAGSGIRPLATLDGGTLRVGQASDGTRSGVPTIDVRLARSVRWTINLDGGATTERIDMTKGALSSLTFGAGVAMASARLPSPVGTMTLTLAGGATQLHVVAPPGAPVRVRAVGGASPVSLDGLVHTGVAGGSVFADPNWATTHNRYTIDLTAGVSDFRLSRS